MSRYGITFDNLWDRQDVVRQHYGGPYTSRAILLDKQGNRVEQVPTLFSTSKFQQLVDDLE